MATNVSPYFTDTSKSRVTVRLLGTGATATDDGAWVRTDTIRGGSIHIHGGVGSVSIHGSNELTVPANSDDGAEVQSATAAEALVSVTDSFKWVKAKVTAYTSGTIQADYNADIGGKY